jgi:hypothetical protein
LENIQEIRDRLERDEYEDWCYNYELRVTSLNLNKSKID